MEFETEAVPAESLDAARLQSRGSQIECGGVTAHCRCEEAFRLSLRHAAHRTMFQGLGLSVRRSSFASMGADERRPDAEVELEICRYGGR